MSNVNFLLLSSGVMGWIVSSQNFYIEALTPSTWEGDYIWRQGIWRHY
jgi:hypothetical protein